MSLITDKAFYTALKASETIMTVIGDRIYSTAVPVPDEELDNVPLPYIVISFDGLTNETMTKDNSYEGEEDSVNIGVMVVCGNRELLGDLTVAIANPLPHESSCKTLAATRQVSQAQHRHSSQ